MTEEISARKKLSTLLSVASFRPVATGVIIASSLLTTLLEGIGLGFILPVVEYARADGQVGQSGGTLVTLFTSAYQFVGLPVTLEFIIFGVAVVMTSRIVVGYLVTWLSQRVQTQFVEHLQTRTYDAVLEARVGYLEQQGSDQVLNELLTRVYYAEAVFGGLVGLIQQGCLVVLYVSVALYLSPVLTLLSGVLFGLLAMLVRYRTASAEALGDRVADAHEEVQSIAQTGTQGIRELKLFGTTESFSRRFRTSVRRYTESTVELDRNQAAMESSYQLVAMLLVFAILYVAMTQTSLGIGELGIFVFVVYRLAPQINGLNGLLYQLDGSLPHIVRTQRFLDELEANRRPDDASAPVPDTVDRVAFRDVSFAYDEEPVVEDVDVAVERGEFVAFVGPSGAGKSTLAALLARLYEPDEGTITANGVPVDQFDVASWRSRVAVVPQDPYILDTTLRENVTFGADDVSEAAFERACAAAQVTEFLDDLPDGYETTLGDDAIRLSGGQQRRVAIARALVRDADVLVLDEATSDLDTALERQVHDAIESLGDDYAVVVITHRLGAVTDADRLYTIEDGRITEAGTHDELLRNGGTYATLYSS